MIDSMKREDLELAAILDTMADGVFVIDNSRLVLRWNRAMERLTGYTSDEAVGRDGTRLLRGQDGEGPDGAGRDGAAGELDPELVARITQDKAEATIVRKDGMSVSVLISGRALKDESGDTVAMVVTLTDLSPYKRFEGEVTRLRRETAERARFDNIVGKSRQMQEVFNRIELAAASQVTVLIQGETGTGKELVAKAIHYHSERRSGPLVSVNCSALSESLLESELFGHVRGAFTGALRDHAGRFERANGGTIFLDEVGDIPPVVQIMLLRVLEEREFERVGESTPRKIDVRVIAATHRDLRERVQQGLFRDDLFYRLKVFPIQLPPLRERRHDMDLLVKEFVRMFNERTGKSILGVSPDAMRIVMDYPWPGNVRELENAIEHAFVICPGPSIGPFDLPIEIRRVEVKPHTTDADPPRVAPVAPIGVSVAPSGVLVAPSGVLVAPTGVPVAPTGRRRGRPRGRPATRERLEALLEECGWNKAEAARRLGITRTSVWRRMKKLGLPLDPPA